MNDKPKVVTPSASTIGTPNPFAALAESPETPERDLESAVEVVDIPDDEYLPNLPSQTATAEAAITTGTIINTSPRAQASIASPTDPISSQEDSDDDLSISSDSTMGSTDITDA